MSNWVTIFLASSRESFVSFQREVLDERAVADHDTRGVHRVLAAEALERAGGVDDLASLRLALVRLAELGARLQRRVDRLVAAHDRRRVHLAELVAHARREPEHPAASRMPCLPLIVWNVTICATWSEP
jgi:hypothetical protein